MSLTIFWGSGSPVSWRTLLALELKELPYESHRLDLSSKEHRSEAFLALSPRGTFPVLRDGELVVRESIAILSYLDAQFPEKPIFGSCPEELAEIWRHIGEHESYLGDAVQTITRSFFRKAGVADAVLLKKALERSGEELRRLNEELTGRDWIVADCPSAADIVYYPTIHRLLRASLRPIARDYGLAEQPLADFPAIGLWLERMRCLPGIDATYPPHWRE